SCNNGAQGPEQKQYLAQRKCKRKQGRCNRYQDVPLLPRQPDRFGQRRLHTESLDAKHSDWKIIGDGEDNGRGNSQSRPLRQAKTALPIQYVAAAYARSHASSLDWHPLMQRIAMTARN